MLQKVLHIILIILSSFQLFGQGEANNWYFGNNAGLNFSTGEPIKLEDGKIKSFENCATVSNADGELLFYSNGVTVWNANHDTMLNGTDLLGDTSSSQGVLFIKKPLSDSIYYIFNITFYRLTNGLYYSEVNINEAGGLGAITSTKNIHLKGARSEKLQTTIHSNKNDIWIASINDRNDSIYVYKIDSSGVNENPIISKTNTDFILNVDLIAEGYIRFSPSGKKLAVIRSSRNISVIELHDFNQETGKVGEVKSTLKVPFKWIYSLDFSPNEEFLYASVVDKLNLFDPLENFTYELHQYELKNNSLVILDSGDGFLGAVQQTPNGKIIIAKESESYIGIINYPNLKGKECNYMPWGVKLGSGVCVDGLPNFPSYYFLDFTVDKKCYGSETEFRSYKPKADSLFWDFGDPNSSINYSTEEDPKHIFSDTGTFDVTLYAYTGTSVDTSILPVIILPPKVTVSNDTTICKDLTVTIEGDIVLDHLVGIQKLWEDGKYVAPHSSRTVKAGKYWLTAYTFGDSTGCAHSDTVEVFERDCTPQLIMPNIFTPNADGTNDLFVPILTEDIVEMQTSIYNRWGRMIYTTNDLNINWTGQDAVDGMYYWMLTFTDVYGNEYDRKGYLQLVR